MKMVNITAQAESLIRGAAERDFASNGVKCPDGTINIPLDEEVVKTLTERALPGETVSDTIVRLFLTRKGLQ